MVDFNKSFYGECLETELRVKGLPFLLQGSQSTGIGTITTYSHDQIFVYKHMHTIMCNSLHV